MDSSRKFDGEVEAEIRDSRHHQQDKENRMVKRAAAVPFYRDPLDLTIIAAGCISLIFMTMAFIVYNRKKKLRSSYEDLPDRKEEQKRSSSCSQASMYGGASQTKSIEFVVPNLPGALSTALSPGEKISTSSQNVPLLCHVSLLDGASSFTSILGGLNPELYKETPTEQDDDEEYPEDNIGRLWFSIKYDAASERLAIKLIKAKNLPSRVHGTINSCDPFVRIFLIPDERRYLQSKIKKKTCNPNFDEEIFVFQIPMKAMEDYSLRLTVYDSERSKRQKIIGHVFFPLKDVQSTSNLMIWRDLSKDEEEEPSEHAQLLVSLCYNQKIERLIVNVFEAKNISIPEGSNCDTYAKVSLLMETKVVKTKKTAVAKKTIEPKYNEPFHFALPIGAAGTASVTIQLCVAGGIQKEKCVGRLVLGSPMFARGKANEHWDEAMATNHRQVRYWHKLT